MSFYLESSEEIARYANEEELKEHIDLNEMIGYNHDKRELYITADKMKSKKSIHVRLTKDEEKRVCIETDRYYLRKLIEEQNSMERCSENCYERRFFKLADVQYYYTAPEERQRVSDPEIIEYLVKHKREGIRDLIKDGYWLRLADLDNDEKRMRYE